MTAFEIAGRRVGDGAPPYLIAEIGVNHGGDPAQAEALLKAAKRAGADAAKFQAFSPEKLMARSSHYFGLLAGAALDGPRFRDLYAIAAEIGVTAFASVFDEDGADAQAALGAPAFKIASGDITHTPLLRHVAGLGRPMILSTGAADMAEVEAAVAAIRDAGPATPLALLHCVSNYPTAPGDANLACMATLRARFQVPVGFSDHTDGVATPIAAAALGAELIEKHFTLDRAADGPDHALSADPVGLAALADGLKVAHAAVGLPEKKPVETPDLISAIRRSVTAQQSIPKGTTITREMLAVKRPGDGVAPSEMERVVGATAARDLAEDQTIHWTDLEAK